jgi:hypothetical protein
VPGLRARHAGVRAAARHPPAVSACSAGTGDTGRRATHAWIEAFRPARWWASTRPITWSPAREDIRRDRPRLRRRRRPRRLPRPLGQRACGRRPGSPTRAMLTRELMPVMTGDARSRRPADWDIDLQHSRAAAAAVAARRPGLSLRTAVAVVPAKLDSWSGAALSS